MPVSTNRARVRREGKSGKAGRSAASAAPRLGHRFNRTEIRLCNGAPGRRIHIEPKLSTGLEERACLRRRNVSLLLAAHFIQKLAPRANPRVKTIDDAALGRLTVIGIGGGVVVPCVPFRRRLGDEVPHGALRLPWR